MYFAWKAYRRRHPRDPHNQAGSPSTSANLSNNTQSLPAPAPSEARREALTSRNEAPKVLSTPDVEPATISNVDVHQATSPVSGAPPDQNAPKPQGMMWKWTLTLMACLLIPIFLETLDYTVVATAQPEIASIFNRLDLQSYIGTSYLLSSTVFLPLFASLADIYGRHFTLQLSLIFFIIGSAVCTGAHNIETILAGRGISGIGGAGILAVVRIILADARSLNQNNIQLTLIFALYTVGFCVGPSIGGALLEHNWRWVFGINLPCAAAGIIMCFIFLRGKLQGPSQSSSTLHGGEKEKSFIGYFTKLARVDWFGTLFFVVGGILFLLALNWGSTQEWHSAKVIVCFVVGFLSFIACILWEYALERFQSKSEPPSSVILRADRMLPLELFTSYDICANCFATFCIGLVMLVMFYFVAIYTTIVSGYSPTKAGVQLVYFAPGMGGGALIQIRLIQAFRQPIYPVVLGCIIVPVALGLISMGMQEGKQAYVNGFMALAGVGVGLQQGALAVHARFAVDRKHNAVVAGLLLFFRSFGGTVGLAQCAAVQNDRVISYITDKAKSGQLTSSELSQLLQAVGSGISTSGAGSIGSLPENLQTMVREAFREGSRWAFISLIPWTCVATILVVFLSKIADTDAGQKEVVEKIEVPEEEKDIVDTPNQRAV